MIPPRRLLDGTLLRQFQCDGTCARDRERAREKARMHAAQHERISRERAASSVELRAQIAITTVLAVLAAMWIALAAREANAQSKRDSRDARRGDTSTERTRDARRDNTSTEGTRDARRGETSTEGTRDARRGNTSTEGTRDARRDDTSTEGTRDARRDARAVRADVRARRVANIDDHEDPDDDDMAIDVAAPSTIEPPFGARVVAPPIAQVLEAAYRTAGLDRDVGRGFVRRARLAGLVPLVSVRMGRDTSWRDDKPDISRGMTMEVRATWRLDRLVFDGRELQVAALEGARRRERRRLAARVIQVYFAWKRAARTSGIQPRSSAVAEEAAAELDDLTDGWFTDARVGSP